MVLKKKLVPINDLTAGMVSASNINFSGVLLLSKDVAITEFAINILKQNYIVDAVEIYSEDEYTDILNVKAKTVKELESTFNNFSSKLQNIFTNISSLKLDDLEELRKFTKRIQEEFKSTGLVIRDIVFYGNKENNIYRHSVNVSALSFILGKWLGLNEDEINSLTYAAVLHDFGKTKLDEYLLNKKIEELTPEEYKKYKTHPILAYHFVQQIPYLDDSVCRGVIMHHERIDGSGYPLGAIDNKIHKFAKIIAIADTFDNITSGRYTDKFTGPFEALKIVQEQSLGKLDNKFCNIFLHQMVNYYMGESVVLSDDRSCKIIQVDVNDITNPLLLDENGFVDLKEEKNIYVKRLVV